MTLSNKTNVLIATFSPWKNGMRLPINGNLEPMLDYFTPKVGSIVLIDQVYPGSDFVLPRIEMHKKGKKMKLLRNSVILRMLTPFLYAVNTDATHTIFKIRDFLSVVITSLSIDTKIDIFIGFEAINAIAGIILKKIGRIGTVVYYVSDYSPTRYPNKLFNDLYLWLDRFCVRNSDFTWDVSKAMQPARLKSGLDPKKHYNILHVPNALYPEQIKFENEKDLEKNSLVFMGTLGMENGPDLAIQAMPNVKKRFPNARLHIIGGGREEELSSLAIKNKVEKNVVFHGFISDRNEVSKATRKYMIGLAPYINKKGSARLYGDATKIRAYTAAGLPVITTSVPPLGQEIVEASAGIIVKDDSKALADAIIKILSNPVLYKTLRNGAIKFAKENTWENVFDKAFLEMHSNEKIN